MRYISTRGKDQCSSSLEAIFTGLAKDGGLYVRETTESFDWEKFIGSGTSYDKIAANVIHTFFSDIDIKKLEEITQKAYKEKFFVDNALEIKNLNNVSVTELYHGPTAAFKDFALSVLPQLLVLAKEDQKVYILTATSGDTGKAALEGFKDIEGTEIFVFYPTDGVSSMQKLQMMTQEGHNVHVFGVEGNFDDAQRGVKEIFQSQEFAKWAESKDIYLSSANSINIGRLVPQVAYYIYSYIHLVDSGIINKGEKIDICVPTGNFGNILAGYYAKKMSLPIENFICASNENAVLTDFFNTGVYEANRDLVKTTSPSMDILVSSNLERLLFEVTRDHDKINTWMKDLKDKGSFQLDTDTREKLGDFLAFTCNSQEAGEIIKKVYNDFAYLIDPHTAVAYSSIEKYRALGYKNRVLMLSTASPYKFPEAVAEAFDLSFEDYREAIEKITSLTKTNIPSPLQNLAEKKIIHTSVIGKNQMSQIIQEV